MTDINLDQIISEKTLSPEELEAYRDLFESEDFQDFNIDMYRQLHFYAFREIIGQLLYHKVPVDVVHYTFLMLWLKSAQKIYPQITDETIENWMMYDANLLDFMYEIAEDALAKAVSQTPSLKDTPYDESLEGIYEDWKAHLEYVQDIVDPDGFQEMTQNVFDILENAATQMTQQSAGFLDEIDIYSIHTELLMQVYIIAYIEDSRVYYHLSKMWDTEIIPHLGEGFLEILVFLQNNPAVLLPENREELMDALKEVKNSPLYQIANLSPDPKNQGESPQIQSLDIDIMA